jgi:hypothetical protein
MASSRSFCKEYREIVERVLKEHGVGMHGDKFCLNQLIGRVLHYNGLSDRLRKIDGKVRIKGSEGAYCASAEVCMKILKESGRRVARDILAEIESAYENLSDSEESESTGDLSSSEQDNEEIDGSHDSLSSSSGTEIMDNMNRYDWFKSQYGKISKRYDIDLPFVTEYEKQKLLKSPAGKLYICLKLLMETPKMSCLSNIFIVDYLIDNFKSELHEVINKKNLVPIKNLVRASHENVCDEFDQMMNAGHHFKQIVELISKLESKPDFRTVLCLLEEPEIVTSTPK